MGLYYPPHDTPKPPEKHQNKLPSLVSDKYQKYIAFSAPRRSTLLKKTLAGRKWHQNHQLWTAFQRQHGALDKNDKKDTIPRLKQAQQRCNEGKCVRVLLLRARVQLETNIGFQVAPGIDRQQQELMVCKPEFVRAPPGGRGKEPLSSSENFGQHPTGTPRAWTFTKEQANP